MKYREGVIDFMVYRQNQTEREAISGVLWVDLPDPFGRAGKKPTMKLCVHFGSILDAVDAMKHSGVQMLTIYAAEQTFDSIERETQIDGVMYEMKAEPCALHPGSVHPGYDMLPPAPEENSPKQMQERESRATFQLKNANSSDSVCEYAVTSFAVYKDHEKIMEVDPQRHLCMIGGVQYPLYLDEQDR